MQIAWKMDVQKWYQSAYVNTLINGIVLLKMIGCSIQIYFGIFLEKSINTNVYVCDLAGLYHSKCHLCVFSFVQWLDGFGVGLVLCGKQQALGQGRRETCPCSYRRF